MQLGMNNRPETRDQRDIKRTKDRGLEVLKKSRSRGAGQEGEGRMGCCGQRAGPDCRDSQNVGSDKVQGVC